MRRLLKQFRGSGRIVVAESAFASVLTAAVLHSSLGLHFIGMVNEYQHRGDHIGLTTQYDGTQLRAVRWGDRKVKSFIATRGTTLDGEPHAEWRNNNDGTTDYFTETVGICTVCTVDAYNAFKLFSDHDDSFDQKKFVKALPGNFSTTAEAVPNKCCVLECARV